MIAGKRYFWLLGESDNCSYFVTLPEAEKKVNEYTENGLKIESMGEMLWIANITKSNGLFLPALTQHAVAAGLGGDFDAFPSFATLREAQAAVENYFKSKGIQK